MSILYHNLSIKLVKDFSNLFIILKKWRELDNLVTEGSNEAQDIVKYLYALEKYCEPLYRSDPTKIPEILPSLLYAIRMVFTTSRYYNTTERITALLVKVTNQVVTCCRNYLNVNETKNIWRQKKGDVINKIQVTLNISLDRLHSLFRHFFRSV